MLAALLSAPPSPIQLVKTMRVSMSAAAAAESWIEDNIGAVSSKRTMGGSGWASFTRYSVGGSGQELFAKTSSRPLERMFLGEASGLRAMHATQSVVVPEVLGFGEAFDGGSYLIMDHLEFSGRPDPYTFGRLMAEMHLAEPSQAEAASGQFGFKLDNTIGGTPQPNGWCDDWVTFFRDQRIGFQIRTAADTQLRKEWEAVLARTDDLSSLFEGISVRPSTLHGDLWSGNIAAVGGQPAIFDPATYYGHHEAEWGMSWCANFPPDFWKGYRELIPEDEGFHRRAALYELYHQLNHYNLFGGRYYHTSRSLMNELLKD